MIHAKKSDVEGDEMQEGDMKCNIGLKEFSKSSNLTRHITNVHEKNKRKRKHHKTKGANKPLQSDYCNKSFTTKFNMKRHRLTYMYNNFDTMYDDFKK